MADSPGPAPRDGELNPAGDAERKKATFLLDANLHRLLKVRAAEEGRAMIDFVEDARTRYLGRK